MENYSAWKGELTTQFPDGRRQLLGHQVIAGSVRGKVSKSARTANLDANGVRDGEKPAARQGPLRPENVRGNHQVIGPGQQVTDAGLERQEPAVGGAAALGEEDQDVARLGQD